MFEATGSGIPDGKLQRQLELIPLRIATNLQLVNLSVGVYSCQFLGGRYILVGLVEMRTCLSPHWRLPGGNGEEAKGWLAMFEAAGSGIPDGKL
jgi:hypothetical protein